MGVVDYSPQQRLQTPLGFLALSPDTLEIAAIDTLLFHLVFFGERDARR